MFFLSLSEGNAVSLGITEMLSGVEVPIFDLSKGSADVAVI